MKKNLNQKIEAESREIWMLLYAIDLIESHTLIQFIY